MVAAGAKSAASSAAKSAASAAVKSAAAVGAAAAAKSAAAAGAAAASFVPERNLRGNQRGTQLGLMGCNLGLGDLGVGLCYARVLGRGALQGRQSPLNAFQRVSEPVLELVVLVREAIARSVKGFLSSGGSREGWRSGG